MAKYDLETIEKAFNNMNINASFTEFTEALNSVEKIEKERLKEEKKKQEALKEVHDIYPALPEGEDVDDFIRDTIPDIDGIKDLFSGEDMDDDGADDTIYVKVGNKIYKVNIHCEAEWCGDWSVRANLPGDIEVEDIDEVVEYELVNDYGDYLVISIK